jgi:hypothetical protein
MSKHLTFPALTIPTILGSMWRRITKRCSIRSAKPIRYAGISNLLNVERRCSLSIEMLGSPTRLWKRDFHSLPPLSGLFQNEIRPRRKLAFKQGVEGTSF